MNGYDRVFWYHLNKPETKKQKRVVWSIHWKGKCYHVHEVECLVNTITKSRKRQPYAIVHGYTHAVDFHEHKGIKSAIIYA